MPQIMTSAQATKVASKRSYPKSAWSAVVDGLLAKADVPGYAKLEADFPGVKPAHVAHMLRQDLKARNITKLTVGIDKELGVFLKRA